MFCLVFNCLGMVLCVPFLTLFERKILSYSQNRKGPKKISFGGLLQPMVDGMKLMMKESGYPIFSKKLIFLLSPIFIFFLSLSSMIILSKCKKAFLMQYKILFFLVLVSCKVFPLFFSGASSKSKYSSLGSFRGAAQVISYEVKAVTILLFPLMMVYSFNSYFLMKKKFFPLLMFPLMLVFWLYCIMAETKRAPFDFAEGESELVSGFNTEYSGLKFTFLFLAEYGKIMMMSIVTTILFLPNNMFFYLIFIYLFVAFRATFPRFRYDLLMTFGWKIILSASLFYFCFLVIL